MANPNISLLGATYSDVAGVTLPKQGGGTATFPWVEGSQSITQNGTVDVTNLAEVVVNVSGGGGASNIVTGTFKGTTAGEKLDITLPYTGAGYPVAVIFYPTEGAYNSNGSFYGTVSRYARVVQVIVKAANVPPTYTGTGDADLASSWAAYKSSNSTASSVGNSTVSGSSSVSVFYNDADPNGSSQNNAVRVRSSTLLSVRIRSSTVQYGFAPNVEYAYCVIYSS